VVLYKPWRRYVDLRRPVGNRESSDTTPVDEENITTPDQDVQDVILVAVPKTK
jgi:hypothetical protein